MQITVFDNQFWKSLVREGSLKEMESLFWISVHAWMCVNSSVVVFKYSFDVFIQMDSFKFPDLKCAGGSGEAPWRLALLGWQGWVIFIVITWTFKNTDE